MSLCRLLIKMSDFMIYCVNPRLEDVGLHPADGLRNKKYLIQGRLPPGVSEWPDSSTDGGLLGGLLSGELSFDQI